MSHINVTINGRQYRMACEEGQEVRLLKLAEQLESRIQALGTDRSRLADELDGALMKARKLERTNREISDRLDAAIVTIRSVLDTGEDG